MPEVDSDSETEDEWLEEPDHIYPDVEEDIECHTSDDEVYPDEVDPLAQCMRVRVPCLCAPPGAGPEPPAPGTAEPVEDDGTRDHPTGREEGKALQRSSRETRAS